MFMLEGFWSIRGVPRSSYEESVFDVDSDASLEGFWRPSWRQVGPKLAQKWSKIQTKSFFGGFRCQFLFFGRVFCSERVRFWRDLRPLGP